MIVISISNVKGGVGKTQIAINLSAELSTGGNVLLIDNDSQANVTQTLLSSELDTFEETMYDVYKNKNTSIIDILYQYNENLYVVPNDIKSATLDMELVSTLNRESILKKKIQELPKGFFKFVIIDNTPALNQTLTNSICASDYYIVVVDNSSSSLQGLNMIADRVDELNDEGLANCKLMGVLRNRWDKKSNISKVSSRILEEQLGDALFETIIYDSVRYKESVATHQTIQEYYKPYAMPFKEIIKEMKERSSKL